MNENSPSRSVTVKLLVIVGFIATVLLLIWLGTKLIESVSPSFENLANVAETIHEYEPEDELELMAEKTIVNSGESFQISWTDMKQKGEFAFTYACDDDVTVLVRREDGQLMPIECTDTLTLPALVHGLYVSIESKETRFADVLLSIAFISDQNEVTHVSDLQVTVVNATVPVNPEVAGVDDTDEEPPRQEEERPTQQPVPQTPTYTVVYPESNPNGYVDLSVQMIGIGEVRNGVFVFTSALDGDGRNAVKFDIENMGTKTSESWDFEITLPDGNTHHSNTQYALRPREHAVFVLEFILDDTDDNSGEIEIEVETKYDSNSKNDDVRWYTKIR